VGFPRLCAEPRSWDRAGPGQTGPVTANPYSIDGLNAEQLADREQALDRAGHLQNLTDDEVIAFQPGPSDDRHLMEMIRRLNVSITSLTGEIVTSRESSGRLGSQLNASITTLTDEIVTFRTSSDEAARKLARLTNVIIGLTGVLVVLTIVLVVLTVQAGHASTVTPARPSHSATPVRRPAAARASHSAAVTRKP
jgi:hypothetical protein